MLIWAIGKFLRYQYDAGAAIESDLPGSKFLKTIRKYRKLVPSSAVPAGRGLMSVAYN